MAQAQILPAALRDAYQESVMDVAYAAESVILDLDDGHLDSRNSLENLRRKVDVWRAAREAYMGPALRELRRPTDVRPVDEVIGL